MVRSTKEVSRIDAIEAVEEIIMKLKENTDLSKVASNLMFSHFFFAKLTSSFGLGIWPNCVV
jgi:hypothetical protein